MPYRTLPVIWLLVLLTPLSVMATHQAGAELTYIYLGNNQYEVTLTLYRDCAGVQPLSAETISYTSDRCGINQTLALSLLSDAVEEITPVCTSSLTNCSGGNVAGIQKYVYKGIIALPSCSDWVLSYKSCCRSCAITTIDLGSSGCSSYPDTYIETHLNNQDFPCNSSPQFNNEPILFLCTNQSFNYNNGVTDPDGDSLTYTLMDPLTDANTPVNYYSPHSATSPLISNPPFSLDHLTGDIKARPTSIEISVLAIKVDEYRNGSWVGSTMRDMQIWVLNCNSTLPTASGVNGSNSYTITACANELLCFDIFSNEIDTGQDVSMSWNAAISNASFLTSGSHEPTATFCWVPTTNDINTSPHDFTLSVRDNACPLNGLQIYSYRILVKNCIPPCDSFQLELQSANTRCIESSNGTATAIANGTSAPYGYLWNTGDTTSSIVGLTMGTYRVTASDIYGCSTTGSVYVDTTINLNLSIQGNDVSCFGKSDGSANVVPQYASGFTYHWSNGETTSDISNLPQGYYEVIAIDSFGCTDTASVMVKEPDSVVVIIASENTVCYNSCEGAARVDISGGIPPYSYSWSNHDTTSSIENLCAGNFAVTVNDAHHCLDSNTFLISIQSDMPSTILTNRDVVLCNGNSIRVGGSQQTVDGVYYDTLTSVSGCDSIVITNLTFHYAPNPVINMIIHDCPEDCDGELTVSVAGSQQPYKYLWSNGAMAASIDSLCPGSYTVTLTDSNGCSATATKTVLVHQPLQVNLTAQRTGCTCTNQVADYDICIINFEGLPHGTILNEQYAAQGIHISNIPYGSGPGELIVFNSDLSGTADADLEINRGGLAIFPENITDSNGDGLVDVPNDIRSGGKQIYTFDHPRKVISFDFVDMENTNGFATAYDSLGNIITRVDIQPIGNASVQTVVLDADNVSKLVIDYYDSGGVTEIRLGCSYVCCDAAAIASVSGGNPPYSFAWNTGDQAASLNNLCAGEYSVTVFDSNGCSITDSILIESFEELNVLTQHTDVTANCLFSGCCDGMAKVIVYGGIPPYTDSWSNGNTSDSISGLCEGTFYVTITDQDGCSIIKSIAINNAASGGSRHSVNIDPYFPVSGLRIKIYPIPFDNFLKIDIQSPVIEKGQLSIIDILGRAVAKQNLLLKQGKNRLLIEIKESIPNGIYVLELKVNNEMKVFRLLKARADN